MSDEPMVEPCAYVRMRRAGWPAARVAEMFSVNIFVVAKAIQDADRAERGIDRSLIVPVWAKNTH